MNDLEKAIEKLFLAGLSKRTIILMVKDICKKMRTKVNE